MNFEDFNASEGVRVMNGKTDGTTAGLDRVNALLAWWGIPAANGKGNIEGQMKRFQALAFGLQAAYGDAYHHQMEALFTANERLSRSFQGFLYCRQTRDVIAVESDILAAVLEGASLQAKAWVDLTRKIQDCYAELTHEGAEPVPDQARGAVDAKLEFRPAQAPARDTSKHLADA